MARKRIPELGATPVFGDARGTLTLVTLDQLPFVPTRAYVLDALPTGSRRGGHASRAQHRFLVGISGTARVTLDSAADCEVLGLGGGETLHVKPGVWLEIEAVDDQVSILVFADGDYDPADQVRDRPVHDCPDHDRPDHRLSAA